MLNQKYDWDKHTLIFSNHLQLMIFTESNLFQSACHLQLWGRFHAGVMAEPTAHCLLIPKPLGTPASPEPENTCVCPSHVVCLELHVITRDLYVLLHHEKTKTTLNFSSVPRCVLVNVGRGSTDPFVISDSPHGESKNESLVLLHVTEALLVSPAGGWYTGSTYRPKKKNTLLTNFIEMIEKNIGYVH